MIAMSQLKAGDVGAAESSLRGRSPRRPETRPPRVLGDVWRARAPHEAERESPGREPARVPQPGARPKDAPAEPQAAGDDFAARRDVLEHRLGRRPPAGQRPACTATRARSRGEKHRAAVNDQAGGAGPLQQPDQPRPSPDRDASATIDVRDAIGRISSVASPAASLRMLTS
jgi:hypothetical protein